jgi:general secretion pathway protein I
MWLSIGSRERFPSPTDHRGFTLVEVLVAFAILALTLVVLLRVFGGGLRAVSTSERYLTAAMLARSVLDDLGIETPVSPGETSADIGDGYRWTTRIAQSRTIPPVKTGNEMQVAYEVQVEIAWNRKPVVTLTTLRLAAQQRQ